MAQRTVGAATNFWTGGARGWMEEVFLAGLARGGDGSFSWVDGTPFDLEFWLEGEPNSIEGDMEDCVEAYYQTAEWNDAHCSDQKAWVGGEAGGERLSYSRCA